MSVRELLQCRAALDSLRRNYEKMYGELTVLRVEVEFYDTPYGREALCKKCGSSVEWEGCWDCGGEGYSYHDCGEDTCCCLDPQPNVVCDTCDGEGGWWVCLGCKGELKK